MTDEAQRMTIDATTDQALREQLAQAVHERSTGMTTRCGYGSSCPYHRALADAVLPVVQAHEKALRDQIEDERNAHARAELLADGDREAARDELAGLREAVVQLADQLDDEVQSITNMDAGALGRRGGLRDAARDVRSLLEGQS